MSPSSARCYKFAVLRFLLLCDLFFFLRKEKLHWHLQLESNSNRRVRVSIQPYIPKKPSVSQLHRQLCDFVAPIFDVSSHSHCLSSWYSFFFFFLEFSLFFFVPIHNLLSSSGRHTMFHCYWAINSLASIVSWVLLKACRKSSHLGILLCRVSSTTVPAVGRNVCLFFVFLNYPWPVRNCEV